MFDALWIHLLSYTKTKRINGIFKIHRVSLFHFLRHKLFISQFHKNHITSDNKLGTTFQYSIILKHFIILWIHRMTKTNTFRSPKNGFVCLLPFVLFIPNITFKHTQFHTNCIVYRILWGIDCYGFVTRCIGNMSSHLHRNIYCQ